MSSAAGRSEASLDQGGRRWSLRLGGLAAALSLFWPFIGSAWPILAWLVLSTAGVAGAYFRTSPGIFGKRADRGLHPLGCVVLAPFLGLTHLSWWLAVAFTREATFTQVAPELWLGRWPRRGEVPAEVEQVIDLTAEMPRPPDRRGRRYLLLPTLDGTGPEPQALRQLLEDLPRRPTYVHCAMGHGRSATLAAILLVRWGHFRSFDEAVAHLQRLRPRVSVKPGQHRVARQVLLEGGGSG